MNRPELPPEYEITNDKSAERPFVARWRGEWIEELDAEHGNMFPARELAVAACWAHWREVGDPAWVAWLDSLPSGDVPQREPFDDFAEATLEHREHAAAFAESWAEPFKHSNLAEPTAAHAIMATNLQAFAEAALRESPDKPSALVRSMFDTTPTGQAIGLMLGGLLIRLYEAPYGSLNEAALDFVNVFVPVLAIADSGRKLKAHSGMAKGRRPS